MDLKTYQKNFRKQLKEANIAIRYSIKDNKIDVSCPHEPGRNFTVRARLLRDGTVLELYNWTKNTTHVSSITVHYIIEYYVMYAKLHNINEILINTSSFRDLPRLFGKTFHIKEINFIYSLGFTQVEKTNSRNTYVQLLAENYKNQLAVNQSIAALFEKQSADPLFLYNEILSNGQNSLFECELKWLGHDTHFMLLYDHESKLYTFKDTASIQLTCKEEQIPETFALYLDTIFKVRKLKNVYQPPTTHLELLLSARGCDRNNARGIMDELMARGYTNQQVEEEAASIKKEEDWKGRKRNNIANFLTKETIVPFLQHYIFVYSDIDGEQRSAIFESEEDIIPFYRQQVIKELDYKITLKKDV